MTTSRERGASERRIVGIEELRGIAALSVLLFHAAWFTGPFGGAGGRWLIHLNVGVWVFFAISGFVLYRPWARAHLGEGSRLVYRTYATRRALRIYPAYWVALVFFVWVIPEIVSFGNVGTLAHVFLVQSYFSSGFERMFAGLPVAWTLVVELTFYCALPAYSFATSYAGARWNRGVVEITGPLLIILGGIFAIHAVSRGEASSWLSVLPVHLPAFGGGMLLAVLDTMLTREQSTGWRKFASSRRLWWIVAILLFLLMPILTGMQPGHELTPKEKMWLHLLRAGVGTAVLVPIALSRRPHRVFAGPVIRVAIFMGTVSYGIYLWHFPLLTFVQRELLGWEMYTGNWLVLAVASFPLILVGATASWFLVEAPAIRLSHRYAGSVKDSAKQVLL